MEPAGRLNERAALAPVWHVGRGRALFCGPLRHNASHRHAVPVYLAGLNGAFRLRVANARWRTCRAAVIPAGIAYEFDMNGEPLGVVYLEPSVAGAAALAGLLRDTDEEHGALLGKDGDGNALRAIYEDAGSGEWMAAALDDLVAFSHRRAPKSLDPRIARAVSLLQAADGELTSADAIARSVGLSSSRFQHLFTAEVGVAFRRYRGWRRLRLAISEIVSGSSITYAAHAAGFADQAHFAREFRRSFGAPATPSLAYVRR
jgi:AraC-like DNA-binding protein